MSAYVAESNQQIGHTVPHSRAWILLKEVTNDAKKNHRIESSMSIFLTMTIYLKYIGRFLPILLAVPNHLAPGTHDNPVRFMSPKF
ncbi:MAG: hypothetical protein WBZ36_15320 [Candidatus Nitrosopolaris sp.]